MKLTGTISAICAGIVLSSCSVFQQQDTADSPAPEQPAKAPHKEAGTKEDKAPAMEAGDAPESPVAPGTADIPLEAPTVSEPHPITDIQAPQTNQPTAPEPTPIADPMAAEATADTGIIPGGLRMRRFAPPEEAVSSSDEAEPAPNSVELHGFRSPSLKGGKLPMNINGKINKAQ